MKPEEEKELPKQLEDAINVFYYLIVTVLGLAMGIIAMGIIAMGIGV